jgi:hypothetical protein
LVHDSSKEATELAEKGAKFPWGPKLAAFTVPICDVHERAHRPIIYLKRACQSKNTKCVLLPLCSQTQYVLSISRSSLSVISPWSIAVNLVGSSKKYLVYGHRLPGRLFAPSCIVWKQLRQLMDYWIGQWKNCSLWELSTWGDIWLSLRSWQIQDFKNAGHYPENSVIWPDTLKNCPH